MSLSEQDRDWVRAMIKEATTESLNSARDFSRERVEGHSKRCPNFRRLFWIAAGMGVGLGLSGPQIVKAAIGLFAGH
jgi:hypothetical protein